MGESPTSLKIALGLELKRLMLQAGLKPGDVQQALACSRSKVTKLLKGQVGIRQAELEKLLVLFKVEAPLAETLIKMAAEARKRGWWAQAKLGMSVPDWFRTYIGLESSAEEIWIYQAELIPGLLQVEAYTKAVIAAVNPDITTEELTRRLRVRTGRQARLIGLNPPRVVVVLSEGAIRRMVGGPDVMREQLKFLLAMTEDKPVEVRIVPFSAGAHAAIGFTFIMLRDESEDEPTTVYVESLMDADYNDEATDPEVLKAYRTTFERLKEAALGAEESRSFLSRVALEL